MTELPFDEMIDALDGASFEACVDLLWPILGYKFLEKENVRPVDLKERISGSVIAYVEEPKHYFSSGKGSAGSVIKYADAIRFYFDNGYFPVEKGSRVESYAQRAREIMSKCSKGEASLSDVEDLFVIYLCLSRSAYPGYSKKTIPAISDIECKLQKDDARLLKNLRVQGFEKAVPPMLRAVAKPEKQDHKQKNFLYLVNALLFSGLMKEKDEFTKEAEA